MPSPTSSEPPLTGRRSWARVHFFLIHPQFEELTSHGEPAIFDHSSAFGQWGSTAVELMQMRTLHPAPLSERLVPGRLPIINHVAYISPTPEEDSAALTAAGHDMFLYGRFGPLEIRFHDTQDALGHTVEIHRQSAFIDHAFRRIADAAHNWDGTNPFRPADWMD